MSTGGRLTQYLAMLLREKLFESCSLLELRDVCLQRNNWYLFFVDCQRAVCNTGCG